MLQDNKNGSEGPVLSRVEKNNTTMSDVIFDGFLICMSFGEYQHRGKIA